MRRVKQFTFLLYWLREGASDIGRQVAAAELEPAIRERVLGLAGQGDPSIANWMVRLPFLDRREWKRRDAILRETPLERVGRLIRAVLEPAAATRDTAATLAMTDPAWQDLPRAGSAAYFPHWRRVSLALQRRLKKWIAQEYFRDTERFEDRSIGYTVAAYRASRLCYGRPTTEFTYDLRDYPDGKNTLNSALRMAGRGTQAVLADLEARLQGEGRADLARRYAPMWHEDVLVAARKKPKILVELLTVESAVINAVIDLGGDPTVTTINRTSRTINMALRNVLGVDMRRLGYWALEEATRILAQIAADRGEHGSNTGALEDGDGRPPGSPDTGVSGLEDGNNRSAHGSG
jgi:hypothetical protein